MKISIYKSSLFDKYVKRYLKVRAVVTLIKFTRDGISMNYLDEHFFVL